MTTLKISAKLAQLKDINAYTDAGAARKAQMHREGKALLKQIATLLGLEKADYDLRSNEAGIAVSGEVTLHTDSVYIQISESSCGDRGPSVLYRSCKGRKDYSGGTNCWTSLAQLTDELQASSFIERLRSFQELQPA